MRTLRNRWRNSQNNDKRDTAKAVSRFMFIKAFDKPETRRGENRPISAHRNE